MSSSSHYVAMAEAQTWPVQERYTMGLFDTRVASLRAFRRYSNGATYDVTDREGRLRWVTQKQMRVYGILHRIAMSPGGTAKMVDIALEANCSVSTVSRTVLKVQAWGIYAIDVTRGRNGGIRVWRALGDRFADYARAARQKLRDLAFRARIKLATLIQGDDMDVEEAPDTTTDRSTVMDASFTGRVLYERAMLALSDPEGEHDPDVRHALLSMDEIENTFLLARDKRRRHDEAIRQAAFAGDWDRWEMLRRERWDQ